MVVSLESFGAMKELELGPAVLRAPDCSADERETHNVLLMADTQYLVI